MIEKDLPVRIAFAAVDSRRYQIVQDVRFARYSSLSLLLLGCMQPDSPNPPTPELVSFCPSEPNGSSDEADPLPLDSPSIAGWASRVTLVSFGERVEDAWRDTKLGLGPAEGTSTDVVSLGEGGTITLAFARAIVDGKGPDFAVFENSFSDDFLELAWVDVSSDGEHFYRFPAWSETSREVESFGTLDPEGIRGFAGKYRQGLGTPFDLADLVEVTEKPSREWDGMVRYVRLVDIVGDGRDEDCLGRPIYDPYPVRQSAGFDLDAIAALHLAQP